MPDHNYLPEVIVLDIVDVLINEGTAKEKIADISEILENAGHDLKTLRGN